MRAGRLLASRSNRSLRLALLFAFVVIPPTVALLWLGVRLLQQDRTLWSQREWERRQLSAQALVQALEQNLGDAERRAPNTLASDGVVPFTLSADGITAQHANQVLWLPTHAALHPAADFGAEEQLEFAKDGSDHAFAAYQTASRSANDATRAGALIRIARMSRKRGASAEALAAYRQLASIRTVGFNEMPVDLLARRQIGALLEELHELSLLAAEAAALQRDLFGGRWALDRIAWELTEADLVRWTGQPLPHDGTRRFFSDVAQSIWTDRERLLSASNGRAVVSVGDIPVTLLLKAPGGDRAGTASVVAIHGDVVRQWLDQSLARAAPGGIARLVGERESIATGAAASPDHRIVKRAVETGLPWTVALDAPPSNDGGVIATREQLLFAALGAIVLLLSGASYLLWRVLHRELRVARLQTAFVAAVSHEFRTPLTSLRHVTDLLEESDEVPRERRHAFYRALSRNTDRLQRLVESLLDFARMEDGRKPYRMAPLSPVQALASVVEEFRNDPRAEGFTLSFDPSGCEQIELLADATALAHAVWNLLDNAVKYSEPGPIAISTERRGIELAIAVTDRGIGVPRAEQAEIFDRFVRGEQALRRGINGTGLGLALVSHIVQAHGGRIELESREGAGSTFTIVLPLAQDVVSTSDERRPVAAEQR